MDKIILIFGGLAIIGYLIWRLAGRFGGPNKEFLKYYEEILNSDKYKVRRRNED
jgi:hypothetical protein